MSPQAGRSKEDDSRSGGVEWGYARVSTHDQDPAHQINALKARGIPEDRIFTDVISGTKAHRPEQAALLERVQPGDTIVVWMLDRWGRSLRHLVESVANLAECGVGFASITEGIDATTSSGRLMMHMFGALAEFEASLIRERTKASLAARKRAGQPLGRISGLTSEQVGLIRELAKRDVPQTVIARSVGTSQPTVSRVLRDELVNLPAAPDDDLFSHSDNSDNPPTESKQRKPKRKAKP